MSGARFRSLRESWADTMTPVGAWENRRKSLRGRRVHLSVQSHRQDLGEEAFLGAPHDAGITGLTFHDLRGTVVTRFALMGRR
jgi:hypothetical protein